MADQAKSMSFEDFTERGKEKPPQKMKLGAGPNRWWLADDKELPAAVMTNVAAIIAADRGRIDSYNTYAKLYGIFTPTFWNGYQLTNNGRPAAPMRDRLTYNIVQSCIDTVVSTVTQNKPKPMFLTSAGDSKMQRKARKLDAFCYGLFYENKLYKMAPKCFRDGCVFGEGIIHPYAKNGRVCYERVLPYELLADYLESHYGEESTLSLHRIKNIDRTELSEAYPDEAEAIATMTNTSTFISAANKSVGDTLTVVESWRLPVGNKPGRHTIVTANKMLFSEDYMDPFFPFAIDRYNPRLYGFYSQGMAEQLVPIQIEINRTLISIQRSLYLGGTHKIFVKAGSKVIKSHFDNLLGTILEYAGDTAPNYVVPQLVQPEIYAHLNSMVGMGYQLPGVSQMQATSMKTPGVNSGRAMRTEANIHSQRFSTVGDGYADVFVDLARITVSVARKAYTQNPKLEAKVPGRRFIEKINWKDVDLENDEFVLQIYPVSKLPTDPEGRLAAIQEMMEGGLITPEVGRRLLDFPDLDAEENLGNATQDYLHKILDDMVEDGKFTPPEPFDNLVQAQKLALEYYAQGKLNNLKESRLELLRRFMRQIGTLEQMANPAPVLPPAPVPQANPAPAPVSDLVPNVSGPVAT